MMLSTSTQRSTYRTPTRSQTSSDWRKTIDAAPIEGNNAESRTEGIPVANDYLPEPNIRLHGKNRDSSIMTTRGNAKVESTRVENDPRTLQAIAEGRRLYVGNMPYMAKPKDVEALFSKSDYSLAHVDMSIDPFTGRNPSYCFVELDTKQQADQAMAELSGRILLGRPVRVRPGIARSTVKRPRSEIDVDERQLRGRPSPVFGRWTRTDASEHWNGYPEQGRRLYVGGLPHMPDHETVNNDVRDLFKGYNVKEAVSKVVVPQTPAFGNASAYNHRYLFVDFPTAEEADRAVKTTDGKKAWGVKIRVQHARAPSSRKPDERDGWDRKMLRSARQNAFEIDA